MEVQDLKHPKKSIPKVTKTYEKNYYMVTDDFLLIDTHYKLAKVTH